MSFSIARIRLAFGVTAAFRAIEIADRVSANFGNAVLHAVAFTLSSSNRTLHHYVGSLRQGTSVFRKFPEQSGASLFCSANGRRRPSTILWLRRKA
jgi:hypothetical protein